MALLLEDMDLNVKAGDDFYSFANGRVMRRFEILSH